jgi:Ca2+-binding RTX toxin-like protein
MPAFSNYLPFLQAIVVYDPFNPSQFQPWVGSIERGGSRAITYSLSTTATPQLTAITQQLLAQVASFADVTFTPTTPQPELTDLNGYFDQPGVLADRNPDIRISMQTDGSRVGGFAEFGWWYNGNNELIDIDSFALIWSDNHYTIIHEMGHALGLAHTSPDQIPAEGPDLPPEFQNNNYTVMHYRLDDTNNNGVLDGSDLNNINESDGEWDYRHFQLYDVYALQQRYGVNMATYSGDSSHTASSLSMDEWLRVLWDASGIDTIDMSAQTRVQLIDLRSGGFSNLGAVEGNNPFDYNLAIAIGADIENAIGGSNNDTIIGNPLNNILNGGDGDDSIDASGGGIDTLIGGSGNDSFTLGSQLTSADVINGGVGTNDQVGISGNYIGGNALVLGANTLTNVEVLSALPGGSYDITLNNATTAAGTNFTVFGGNLVAGNSFRVNASTETDGAVTIFGGLGTDTFIGGAGNDGFYFGPGRWDRSTDTVNGGGGVNDQLALDGNYSINVGAEANVETLALLRGPVATPNTFSITLMNAFTPSGQTRTVWGGQLLTSVTIIGSAENDGNLIFFGGTQSDTLTTGTRADTLWGGGAGDTLRGGQGNDIFRYDDVSESTGSINSTRDRILDFATGDKIDLSRIDAISGGSDNAFTFIGSAAFGNIAGQLRSVSNGNGTYTVHADVNGDGVADLSILVTKSSAVTVSDFIL